MDRRRTVSISSRSDPEREICRGHSSSMAWGLQDPTEATCAAIDKIQSRGVSGSVAGLHLSGLIPDAIADVRATVTLWVDAGGMVWRLRIEGQVVAGDPAAMVRDMDLGVPE